MGEKEEKKRTDREKRGREIMKKKEEPSKKESKG